MSRRKIVRVSSEFTVEGYHGYIWSARTNEHKPPKAGTDQSTKVALIF